MATERETKVKGFKRINFFKGFLTTEHDWNDAERYHIEKRRLHNRMIKKALKTQIKKVQQAAATGTVAELQTELKVAAMKLDKAAVKHVIHKNLAARKKSQLAKLLHAKQAAAKTTPAGTPNPPT